MRLWQWSSTSIAAGACALLLAGAVSAQTTVRGADLSAENAACFDLVVCEAGVCVAEPGCAGLAKHRIQGNRLRELRVLGETFRSLAEVLPASAQAALNGDTSGCVVDPDGLLCGACVLADSPEFPGVTEAECTIADPITFRVRNTGGTVRYTEAVSDIACFIEDGVPSQAADGHPLDVCPAGFRVRVRGGAAANHPLATLADGWQLCVEQNGAETCAPFVTEAP